ncbi:MAG: Tex-like N-terminal domain-containing protein [Bacilli bacterium]
MKETIILQVASELNISEKQVNSVLGLLEEKNTVPFIARYRKEVTGGLDEKVIHEIEKHFHYANSLQERKETVIRLIMEKGLLDDKLKQKILNCKKLVEVEDIYLPFKEKKNTLATIAKKNGLEPLAKIIILQKCKDIYVEAKKYLSNEIDTLETAITGACHIISENIADVSEYRKFIRDYILTNSTIRSKKKKKAVDENSVYKIYYDYEINLTKIKNHQILALNRGEKEKVLSIKIDTDKNFLVNIIYKKYCSSENECSKYILNAIEDGFARLIFPSIEREIRSELTKRAEKDAILLFSKNLEQLLMQPPLRQKRILGLDPAYRTGCKLAVVNEYGDLLTISKIYLHHESESTILKLIKEYNIDVIAIGNGTASRESEELIAKIINENKLNIEYIIVNEAGASVYSASSKAREEFPDLAVEERSAISIARRLQDPLAEFVKIDSKSIGVGQYQHDVNQKLLKEELDFTVLKVVNDVGVDINSASETILCHISGISKKVAKSIIDYRKKNGKINNRDELKKINFLGEKCFEQAAGFLRIINGSNFLDQTSIHPESYRLANLIISDNNLIFDDFKSNEFKTIIKKLDINQCAKKYDSDRFTIDAIKKSLLSPTRDPRNELDNPKLRSDVTKLDDLEVGMLLDGTVRNIVDFGAFIDIGLKNDALVHISKICKQFIKHPMEILSIGEIVKVTIDEIDKNRGKVSVTML